MRTLALAFTLTLAIARPALAQSNVFVGGGMFADLKRFSGDPATTTLDGNGIGGGGQIGVMVSDRWNIRLALDIGSTTTRSSSTTIALPVIYDFTALGLVAPPQSLVFSTETANRLFATSVLLGYQTAGTRRVRPGVFGGLTFMHVTRRVTLPNVLPLATTQLATIFPLVDTQERIDNVPAATVGAEAAIELTPHFAAVPEVRAHAFSLSGGGPSGFVIRPGIAVRWTF